MKSFSSRTKPAIYLISLLVLSVVLGFTPTQASTSHKTIHHPVAERLVKNTVNTVNKYLVKKSYVLKATSPTQEQQVILQDIFGSSAYLKSVQYRTYLKPDVPTAAFTIGNVVYFTTSTYTTATLVHETTHAWQYGQFLKGQYSRGYIQTIIYALKNYHAWGIYEFELHDGDAWKDFDIEQQAELIENYYLIQYTGAPNDNFLNYNELGKEKALQLLSNLIQTNINSDFSL